MPGQLGHELYFWGPHQVANGTGEQEPQAEVLGSGSSSDPVVASGTKNFMEFRFEHQGASGDIRGMYLRTYYNGGAGGDCARIFSTVQTDCGTVHGAHISLNYDDALTSGQGIAARCTLHVPNATLTGLSAPIESEIYCDGASSDVNNGAFFYANLDGTSGGKDNVDDNGNFFNIQGLTAGGAHMFRTGLTAATVNAATTAALRIKVGSTTYFIPLATATS
jgi:hypothetical protein